MNYRVKIRVGMNDEIVLAEGILTDEHASCSYGLPVVLVDGEPRGSGEIGGSLDILDSPDHTRAIKVSDTDAVVRRWRDMESIERRAKTAGYRLAFGLPQ